MLSVSRNEGAIADSPLTSERPAPILLPLLALHICLPIYRAGGALVVIVYSPSTIGLVSFQALSFCFIHFSHFSTVPLHFLSVYCRDDRREGSPVLLLSFSAPAGIPSSGTGSSYAQPPIATVQPITTIYDTPAARSSSSAVLPVGVQLYTGRRSCRPSRRISSCPCNGY